MPAFVMVVYHDWDGECDVNDLWWQYFDDHFYWGFVMCISCDEDFMEKTCEVVLAFNLTSMGNRGFDGWEAPDWNGLFKHHSMQVTQFWPLINN